MSTLNDHVTLVTGGGRGIGRAVALAFAAEGARVAITARNTDELNQVTRHIKETGGEAMAVCADLADRAAPVTVVKQVRDRFGPIDVLVNNAGIGSSAKPMPVAEFDDDFWDLTMAVNLTAPYLLSKLVLTDMLARKHGRIIMIASINGKIGSFHGAAYAASKHGVLGLMRTLAMELAGEGVTVNAICPGPVRSRMNDRRVEYDAQRRGRTFEQEERASTPIGRRLEPEEIAPLAVYLAGDAAAAVTGQAFNIDGGSLMAS